ncbi:hypothetical protein DCAR_0416142 [Daucus carota subsp. sativus]|uniref:Uncharacterized protein n=1 Tax=Daucus carota subsp. sativus TaxID=79200 RepID=A0AAF0WZH9_DAUCS|nr:hypothetical protein DCAR_0416142 [Daucus carota subsp. sativus]
MRGRLRAKNPDDDSTDRSAVEGAMLGELGLKIQEIELFYLIPGTGLPHGILPVETQTDLDDFVNMVPYSHHQVLYATTKKITLSNELMDFSFTQFFEDERIERIENMRVEVEAEKAPMADDVVKKPAKKKRRIPPPNPPFRTRKKGRYSMLRGLFKNTSETPVIIEDEGPELTQKGVQVNETTAERGCRSVKLQQRRRTRSLKLKQRRRLAQM